MAKKKKTRNAVKTRLRILKTATRLFGQNGYAATSMRDIGAAADIRAATLYHYVPSKTDLLYEIFTIFYTDLACLYREIEVGMPDGCPLNKGLRFFMQHHRAFLHKRRDETYLFFLEILRPGTPLSRKLRKMTAESTGHLHRIAACWPDLPRDRIVTLFMGVVSMNVFFLMAEKYMSNAVRIDLPPAEQSQTLELLFDEAETLEDTLMHYSQGRTECNLQTPR